MSNSVIISDGQPIDFDKASATMDQDLLAQSIAAMEHERDNAPRWDASYDEQWVWDHYWDSHYEKYGEFFVPDVSSHRGWPRTRLPEAAPRDLPEPD